MLQAIENKYEDTNYMHESKGTKGRIIQQKEIILVLWYLGQGLSFV